MSAATLGSRVKAWRTELGLSQRDLPGDLRQRTPAEMACALQRDAQHLVNWANVVDEEEQKLWYRKVAANLREAAVKLAEWQGAVEALNARSELRVRNATVATLTDCRQAVACINEAVPNTQGDCAVWRKACAAINAVLGARLQSEVSR